MSHLVSRAHFNLEVPLLDSSSRSAISSTWQSASTPGPRRSRRTSRSSSSTSRSSTRTARSSRPTRGRIAISLSPHQFSHWSQCTLPSITSVCWCHTPIFFKSVFLSRTSDHHGWTPTPWPQRARRQARRPASARPHDAPADLQSARLRATGSHMTVERHGPQDISSQVVPVSCCLMVVSHKPRTSHLDFCMSGHASCVSTFALQHTAAANCSNFCVASPAASKSLTHLSDVHLGISLEVTHVPLPFDVVLQVRSEPPLCRPQVHDFSLVHERSINSSWSRSR